MRLGERAGWTIAVVSGEPMRPVTTTSSASQSSSGDAPAAARGRRTHRRCHALVAPVAVDLVGSWAWRAKLRRASASSGLPAHQSSARNAPALPDEAQATPVRSTTVTSAPRRLEEVGGRGADHPAAADHDAHLPDRACQQLAKVTSGGW